MTNYTIIQNSIIHNTNIIVSNNILTASVTNAHSIHSCTDTQSDHQLRNTQFLSAFSTQLYIWHTALLPLEWHTAQLSKLILPPFSSKAFRRMTSLFLCLTNFSHSFTR